jgi:hypothetical protein
MTPITQIFPPSTFSAFQRCYFCGFGECGFYFFENYEDDRAGVNQQSLSFDTENAIRRFRPTFSRFRSAIFAYSRVVHVKFSEFNHPFFPQEHRYDTAVISREA